MKDLCGHLPLVCRTQYFAWSSSLLPSIAKTSNISYCQPTNPLRNSIELLSFRCRILCCRDRIPPPSAKDPAPHHKVGDSLGAVGSCGSIRTPSPIPRSAPDPAHIPPHFGAKPKPEIEKRALRSPKPETEMVAPPEIGAKSDRKWNRWRPDHVISCSFGRQTTGNGNDGAPIALWTGYRIEGPTWHQLLWSIKD